ncbi:MAG: acyl-CoA dehydrogenase family protein [Burkholderiales bacterium]
MEPILSEPQSLMRETAVRLCKDHGGPKRARELRNAGTEMDIPAWMEILRSGWLLAAVKEEAGGLGMGMFDICLAMEEAGKQLLMVPFAEVACVAHILGKIGPRAEIQFRAIQDGLQILVPALPQEGWGNVGSAYPTAKFEGGSWYLNGRLRHVGFAKTAQAYFVAASVGDEIMLCMVLKHLVELKTVFNVDGSTSSELVMKDALVEQSQVMARGEEARVLLENLEDLLAITTGAALVGVSSQALDMTLEYIKFRQQFGKALGSFQALQHRAADCFVDIELNRSLVYRVAASYDAHAAHRAMAAAVKARTSRVALAVTRNALQLHGAIGYTDEHDIGLYYKRAITLAALYGNDINQTARFSALTL